MTGLEKLKSIGAHKIFETTHIAKKYAQDILNEEFSSMTKIQFAGFISILEREYNVDLEDLILAYGIVPKEKEETKKEPFIVTSADDKSAKKTNKTLLIVVVLAVIAVLITVFNLSTSVKTIKVVKEIKQNVKVINELNNTTIEQAKTNLEYLDDSSLENMQGDAEEEVVAIEPVHRTKFIVTPRSKLWVGIVDLDTFKRTQKLSSSPFELDADKEWLLVMGHGFVNFDVNDEKKNFNDKNKVWFAYENGVLSKLTRSEFKEKNRGKAW